jgi:hypothetical protein
MAFGEQLRDDNALAYTIHVWPTRELVDESWGWPESWHAAYEEFAWMLGLAVATQVLEGGSFARREVEITTSISCVQFRISQTGTTIHITISGFAGPHAPGPNGGITQQPTAIGGLVLGLHGANRYFYVAVFHGVIPDIPVSNILPSREHILCKVSSTRFVARANEILLAIGYLKPMLRLDSRGPVCGYIDCECAGTRKGAEKCENSSVGSTLRKPLTAMLSHKLRIQFTGLPDSGIKEEKGFGLFCGILEWKPWNCDLPAPPNIYLQLRQQNLDYMHGRYLH